MSRFPFLRRLLLALVLVYLVFGALSYLGNQFWFFETLSNLRVQWAWAGLGFALVLILFRMPLGASAALVAGLVHTFVALHVGTLLARPAPMQQTNLTVTTVNIDRTRDRERLVAILASEKPDVLLMIEDTPEMRRSIGEELGYPYHVETGADLQAISICSRYPLGDPRVETTDNASHILSARIAVPTPAGMTDVLFIATHPTTPLAPWEWQARKTALDHLAERAALAGTPVILAGDLNLTAHSPLFARLQKASGLTDTALARHPKPTWLGPAPAFGLRIDHVLVSNGIAVTRRHVSRSFGSDHRALTVDLAIR